MNKHAYLIMAHGNWSVLEKLLLLLDSERNDIYLHIDANAHDFNSNLYLHVKKSKVILIDRIPVYWADFSQVDVTLKLLNAARTGGDYSYFHLLSGTDLPIKSNKEIYEFFESSGKEFVGIVPQEVYYSVRRVKYYHPFLHNRYYRSSKALKGLDRICEYLQKIFCVNRLRGNNWKIIDGWTWFSITKEFCEYILSNENEIRYMFSNAIAPDELFIQTLVYNSDFMDRLYDASDLKNGSMRYIDWKRGKPYTWGGDKEDFELLIQSPYMFARKFDENKHEIVNKIFEEIGRRNNNDK